MYRLISEISPDFLIQGLGLHQDENQTYIGKVGGQEVQLVTSMDSLHVDNFLPDEKDLKIFCVGFAEAGNQFRSGDILMSGSDDLLDRAFRAMDEIEQRGVVVSLTQDSKHLYVSKEEMDPFLQEWKRHKISFLCLWMVNPVDSEGQAKLVSILRKVFLRTDH